MPKLNHFLAVYIGDEVPDYARMFDQLRYDRCHPVTTRFDEQGFVVLMQPYVKDMRGGFTLARWASRGFTTFFEGKAEARHLPFELEDMMAAFLIRKGKK